MSFFFIALIIAVIIIGFSLPINRSSTRDVSVIPELSNSDEDYGETLEFAQELSYQPEEK